MGGWKRAFWIGQDHVIWQTHTYLGNHEIIRHSGTMLTATCTGPFTSNLSDLARELLDDLFGAVDGRLLTAGSQCRQAWCWVAACLPSSSSTTAFGHAAHEGGGTRALVAFCNTSAARASEATVARTACTAGRLGTAFDIVASSRAGVANVGAPSVRAFPSGDANPGSV